MNVLGNPLPLKNGGTLIPAFIMQIYLAKPHHHWLEFPIHIKSWVYQSLWLFAAEGIHQGDVFMSAFNKSFSRGAPHWHTVNKTISVILGELLTWPLTPPIAVTCLHELGKSEIFDVHFRHEITMYVNIYICFLLESLKSHLLLWYWSILLFDARHLLSSGFNHWNHTSLYTAQHKSHLQMFLSILLKHNIVRLWSGKMLKQQV